MQVYQSNLKGYLAPYPNFNSVVYCVVWVDWDAAYYGKVTPP